MDVPYFQNDPRWANKALGLNPDASIRDYGCLLTSMTMVANHFGGNYTPDSYNEVMKQVGGFNPGQQWIKTFAISKVLPDVKFQKSVECPDTPAPLADIEAGLAAGSLVVVNVDRDPKDTTFSPADGHWVVIYKKQGDDYLIWDPSQQKGASDTLVGRYGFGYKDASQIIKQAIWFGVGDFPTKAGAPAPARAPIAATRAVPPTEARTPRPGSVTQSPAVQSAAPASIRAVQPTVDQLAMRRQPVVDQSNMVKLLAKNSVLVVLEGGSRLGQQNQWLKVRDPAGAEGYVAAWFVQETSAPAPAPAAQVPAAQVPAAKVPAAKAPAPAQLVVTTTGDQVALRTQPVVAANTLIRYLPLGTKLEVTEGSGASAKIGAQNQWLKVRAGDGGEGYVAAWFVV